MTFIDTSATCEGCRTREEMINDLLAENRALRERLQISIEYSDGQPVGFGEDEIDRLRARVAELEVRLGTTACGESMCFQYRDLQAENQSLRRDVDVYQNGILAVVSLIESSLGVYGLHLNGELAPWDTLRTDGGYEDWLQSLDAAVDVIDKAQEEG